MTNALYAQTAVQARRLARYARYGPADLLDAVRGRRADLVPPRRLDFVGRTGFEEMGQHFLRHFIALGGLTPDDEVLDVGCGIGRMAVPLTGYLAPDARYAGFDIVPEGIRWCQRHITALRPSFSFELADVHNPRYNPRGSQPADAYTFPYGEERFDFAFATSLFTHLQPAAIDRYLREIGRVLRPGGRALVTF
ncbi:MAG TPA: methyltransferase domain-containing protein, partial [Solirubrobacteraceae bacterium]